MECSQHTLSEDRSGIQMRPSFECHSWLSVPPFLGKPCGTECLGRTPATSIHRRAFLEGLAAVACPAWLLPPLPVESRAQANDTLQSSLLAQPQLRLAVLRGE